MSEEAFLRKQWKEQRDKIAELEQRVSDHGIVISDVRKENAEHWETITKLEQRNNELSNKLLEAGHRVSLAKFQELEQQNAALREEAAHWRSRCVEFACDEEELRKQLAERDALVRKAFEAGMYAPYDRSNPEEVKEAFDDWQLEQTKRGE